MAKNNPIDVILNHIEYLSKKVRGRGSCTSGERHAAVYAAAQLKQVGVKRVAIEEFSGSPSAYLPYTLAFFVTILGSLLVWFFPDWHGFTFPAAAGLLGAGGMLLQSNLDTSWMRQVLRQRRSQNVVGVVPPKGRVKQRVVLCAHLDTHRTPVFYSSENWLKVFSLLLEGAFISMLLTLCARHPGHHERMDGIALGAPGTCPRGVAGNGAHHSGGVHLLHTRCQR